LHQAAKTTIVNSYVYRLRANQTSFHAIAQMNLWIVMGIIHIA